MAFNDLKKNICSFCKTQLNGNKTQEETELEEKVLVLNSRENKYNNNGKFFKGECKNCDKYGYRDSYFWGKNNKGNDNINNKINNKKPRFNRECNNCEKIGHRAVDCWENKGREKYYDIDNLFVGENLCGEVRR